MIRLRGSAAAGLLLPLALLCFAGAAHAAEPARTVVVDARTESGEPLAGGTAGAVVWRGNTLVESIASVPVERDGSAVLTGLPAADDPTVTLVEVFVYRFTWDEIDGCMRMRDASGSADIAPDAVSVTVFAREGERYECPEPGPEALVVTGTALDGAGAPADYVLVTERSPGGATYAPTVTPASDGSFTVRLMPWPDGQVDLFAIWPDLPPESNGGCLTWRAPAAGWTGAPTVGSVSLVADRITDRGGVCGSTSDGVMATPPPTAAEERAAGRPAAPGSAGQVAGFVGLFLGGLWLASRRRTA